MNYFKFRNFYFVKNKVDFIYSNKTFKSGDYIFLANLLIMSISIQPEIIIEIATDVEMGLLVFYNIETKELVSYPDELSHSNFEASEWKTEINMVKKDRKKYLKFEPMFSGQEMRMMNHFVKKIGNKNTREVFEEAINNRKPFRAFKHLLQEDDDLQQNWYSHKTEHYIQWVKEQLETYNL